MSLKWQKQAPLLLRMRLSKRAMQRKKLALPAIVDDSGLEVDYLKGALGFIPLARWRRRIRPREPRKLLNAMQGVPEAERTACFTAY